MVIGKKRDWRSISDHREKHMRTRMKNLIITGRAIIGLSTGAQAQDNCSAEAIQTKSGEVATALQTISAEDPDRAQVLSGEIEELMTAIQNGADISTVCVFFDDVIAEAAS
jgi:hypothetical protein